MDDKDYIKELFAEKLKTHEIPVNSEVWASLSSKIASTTTGALVSSSAIKIISGIICASTIAISTYFVINSEKDQKNKTVSQKETLTLENRKHTDKTKQLTTKKVQQKNKTIKSTENEVEQISHKYVENNNIEHFSQDSVDDKIDTQNDKINILYNTNKIENYNEKNNENIKIDNNIKDEQHKELIVKDLYREVDKEVGEAEIKQVESFEVTRLPNIYSLHSSGYFSIEYSGEYIDFQLTILNEKNQVIFSSNDPKNVWNGEDALGNIVPIGNYFYIITALDFYGNKINKYSSLKVIP